LLGRIGVGGNDADIGVDFEENLSRRGVRNDALEGREEERRRGKRKQPQKEVGMTHLHRPQTHAE